MRSPENQVSQVARAQQLVNSGSNEAGAALALSIFENSRASTGQEGALARRIYARAQLHLANEAYEHGDTDLRDLCLSKACREMEKAVEFYRKPENEGTFMLPDTLQEHALLLARSGRLPESRLLLEESLKHLTAADRAEGKHWSEATTRLANFQISLLSFMKECFPGEDRISLLDQMIEVGKRHSPINQNIAAMYSEKGQCHEEQGRTEQARECYQVAGDLFAELGMDDAAAAEFESLRQLAE